MNEVSQIGVTQEEDGVRLDRWFKRRFPMLTHGRLEKLLRTGQVRVDGARAKANARLAAGQVVRVPPLGEEAAKPAPKPERSVSDKDAEFVRSLVIHKDKSVLVLNKPAGLAVQGGTKTERHLDGMLDALAFEGERPRLVHRLDRDTSGVLVLARTARAAASLARAFKQKDARKIYWALVVGVPVPRQGTIDLALTKQGGPRAERVFAAEKGDENARDAATHFSTVAMAAHKLAWVAFMPLTGRTHQIRAHAAAISTPIVGDGKYGGVNAHPGGEIPRKLHLHARSIDIAHPDGGRLFIEADLPPHMKASWKLLGFDLRDAEDAFAGLEE
ncbi:RluA family pseudouridine synthase [Parvibaculum sp.]|uniref:RluA family pseudouridine synthase n=1 Tax=Parvibaculum sp. TaxID=2024848 RepID=UPI000C5EA52A|nr:RluA family pseudouridine synthase [Parvibaculum sp.]MAU59269.1 RNA pseudouridine synthase [Parvibaculum sp.]MBO6669669.1 RluA family pseudouridine synthase [Parvibaculum sp.]MBO6692692.1 RluA family pseudouridine synthase [Parvibaculum sp.]MBO6716195.1 RluA family pseudouridine synthase [Parvibaculum sp.]